ncbi:DUF4421 domain-containing protein [Flavobacterium sp. N1994]|uniref:DUF4421 domain-containing protein n=1 Tax=Flavobacterium sp. N1994 TaxID=2986827 RepID=UPI002223AE8A|nr:DUF4421 domain-containing protein [Flavobacterium sp. N1994]
MDIKYSHIIFYFTFFNGWAQNDSISNSYFKSYDDKVTSSLYYLNTSNSFDAEFTSNGTQNRFEFKPNTRQQLGVNISYKFIDISYGFSPRFFSENKDNSGSKLMSLNTRIVFKKWMQSFTFINQTGFYVKEGNTEVSFPNLRTTKIGGTTSYVFNDHFSFKTLSNQKEWQTKSAGSFIPSFTIYYTNFDLNDDNTATQSDIFLFSLAPSYYYNFVIKKNFLLATGLSFGLGLNDIDGTVSSIYEVDSSLKLGYNNDSFFAFVNYNYNNFIQNKTSSIQINDNISTVKFILGYRFNPPKKVKELYNRVSKKIGF